MSTKNTFLNAEGGGPDIFQISFQVLVSTFPVERCFGSDLPMYEIEMREEGSIC